MCYQNCNEVWLNVPIILFVFDGITSLLQLYLVHDFNDILCNI